MQVWLLKFLPSRSSSLRRDDISITPLCCKKGQYKDSCKIGGTHRSPEEDGTIFLQVGQERYSQRNTIGWIKLYSVERGESIFAEEIVFAKARNGSSWCIQHMPNTLMCSGQKRKEAL